MSEYFTVRTIIGMAFFLVWEVIAIGTLFSILMRSRSAAGAWGWGMAMVAFPFITVPLYWVFGRQQFQGYLELMRHVKEANEETFRALATTLEPHLAPLTDSQKRYGAVLETLSDNRFTRGNEICLLIDGDATFKAMLEAIRHAKDYVLLEFFIVKNDVLGNELRSLLEEKARSGVRILFIYDEVGCHKLPRFYIESLVKSGVAMHRFHSTQGPSNRFQINFRNHRKIVVVDGETGFIGGINVGDEYLGKNPKYGDWRDTHVQVTGPSVLSLQMIFLSDYYWSTRQIPELRWTSFREADGMVCGGDDAVVLMLPTGPVERIEGGTMFFLNAINRAKYRLWIATPYFVTDDSIRSSLQLSALRGVDVRIMIPETPDKYIPWLATFAYLSDMEAAGVRIFRYKPGFLHQKVLLVDDELAAVGSANLDNRSMRLNFEATAVALDKKFASAVELMLEKDFAECREVGCSDYSDRPWWFRLAVKLARLFSPVL